MPGMISVRAFAADDKLSHIGNIIVRAKKLDTEATTSLAITF
jgi:hypothetical protein